MGRGSGKNNILVFWPNNDWGLYGRTYEKVSEHLAGLDEVGRVVCIFPPDARKRWSLLRPLSSRKVAGNLWLVNENREYHAGEASGAHSGSRPRQYLSTRILRVLLRRLGFRRDNTILWLFPPHPYLEELLETVPHHLVVSQVVDNFAKLEPSFWLYDFAREQYPKLGRISDVVITSTRANYEEFSQDKQECYLFDNAVDASFIGSPAVLPSRINGASPRLGYVGWITERTDLALIEYIARQRPGWSLLIAGPQYGHRIEETALASLPNVHYLGPIPYAGVANFLQTLDVCLIPHRDTPYSRTMSPLKLYQYLASGRPIVSSAIEGIGRFREYIHVADSHEGFVEKIEQALQNDTMEQSARRIELAREETWDKRVREMYSVVRRQLAARAGSA